MNGINKAIILGTLGRDPETRYAPSGSGICNLSVATSEKWKDRETGEAKEKTEWHRISAFGKLADIMGQYLKKGSHVYIEGKIVTRKWQDSDGKDRYSTEIVANQMQMLDGKQGTSQHQAPRQQRKAGEPIPNDGDFDSRIPF